MAQNIPNEVVSSPKPLGPERQDSIHPGLLPSVTNVPVTPGIDLSTYASDISTAGNPSYFSDDVSQLRGQMAQSPSEAAAGAKTDEDVLQRLSLANASAPEPAVEADPRVANPSLSLSGSVISATFCIPHILEHRKGADWVGTMFYCKTSSLMLHRNSKDDAELLLCSTHSHTSLPKRRVGTTRWLAGLVR
jgi:hypothetical protein